jgi:hypothetical protein
MGLERRFAQHDDDSRFAGDKIPDYACLFLGLDSVAEIDSPESRHRRLAAGWT